MTTRSKDIKWNGLLNQAIEFLKTYRVRLSYGIANFGQYFVSVLDAKKTDKHVLGFLYKAGVLIGEEDSVGKFRDTEIGKEVFAYWLSKNLNPLDYYICYRVDADKLNELGTRIAYGQMPVLKPCLSRDSPNLTPIEPSTSRHTDWPYGTK